MDSFRVLEIKKSVFENNDREADLLREELKLNQPQAADGWLTQDALWLVSKTVSDKLRAHLLAQGIDGIPSSNTAVFNVLQDHGIALATPDGKAIWKATITSAGSRPARNMVLMGTRAMMAYMISGTDGASSTPSALALVTRLMPRRSGTPASRKSGSSSPPRARMVTPLPPVKAAIHGVRSTDGVLARIASAPGGTFCATLPTPIRPLVNAPSFFMLIINRLGFTCNPIVSSSIKIGSKYAI